MFDFDDITTGGARDSEDNSQTEGGRITPEAISSAVEERCIDLEPAGSDTQELQRQTEGARTTPGAAHANIAAYDSAPDGASSDDEASCDGDRFPSCPAGHEAFPCGLGGPHDTWPCTECGCDGSGTVYRCVGCQFCLCQSCMERQMGWH